MKMGRSVFPMLSSGHSAFVQNPVEMIVLYIHKKGDSVGFPFFMAVLWQYSVSDEFRVADESRLLLHRFLDGGGRRCDRENRKQWLLDNCIEFYGL